MNPAQQFIARSISPHIRYLGKSRGKWKGRQSLGVEPRTPLAWAASVLPLSHDSWTTLTGSTECLSCTPGYHFFSITRFSLPPNRFAAEGCYRSCLYYGHCQRFSVHFAHQVWHMIVTWLVEHSFVNVLCDRMSTPFFFLVNVFRFAVSRRFLLVHTHTLHCNSVQP